MYTNMTTKKTKEKAKGKNGLSKAIEIPSEINARVENRNVILSKSGKEVSRKLNLAIDARLEGNLLTLSTKKSKKREGKIMGSETAHIKNLIEGLTKGFKYRLQVANVHFPITLEYDKINNKILIKNFLGEKTPRCAAISPGVDVKIIKDVIELESPDIEKAGQTAANIEKATKIRLRDRRVFQDGVYITEKPGRNFLE